MRLLQLLVLLGSPWYVARIVTVPGDDPVNATKQLPFVRVHMVSTGREIAPFPVDDQVTVPVGV